MCGIAGIANHPQPGCAAQQIRMMTRALARRGPDAEGLEHWSSAVLGHRRLSIFDLSDAGRQPMLSPGGETGVVFNGAIYNFHELRAELERAGYLFRSNTDTEVLVHGYRHWGIDQLIARLRGMFAFAVWDDSAQKLFLVRDRLGVKPLVYAVRDGALAFASTVRALREGGFADAIDDQAVAEFLEFGYITDDRTIYRGVHKLPAATIGEWSGGRLRLREYWHPPLAGSSGSISFDEAVDETERLFLRAVELRLQADVPVGALLSGGVDSGLVCWAISRLGGNITAFTVGAPGDELDETDDARRTAAELGVRHRILPLTSKEPPDIGALVSAYGEPFACGSAIGMLQVSEAVRREATVLLTGDGGDDVFLGYPEHLHFFMAQNLARRTPAIATHLWQRARRFLPDTGAVRRAKHFLDYAAGGLGAVTAAHDGLPAYHNLRLLGPRLAGVQLAQREIEWSLGSARNLLTDFLAYDRRMRFVGEYMTKVDGGTMYHALEARSPFLDQEVWTFAASLPYDLRLHGGKLKAVLREIARRRISPRVASGRKRGFGVPVHRWMVGPWRRVVEAAFEDSVLAREGFIDRGRALAELQNAVDDGWAPNSLWRIFVLDSWMARDRTVSETAGAPAATAR
jgi:asparagine synthase (glutamine-hydrolysing)